MMIMATSFTSVSRFSIMAILFLTVAIQQVKAGEECQAIPENVCKLDSDITYNLGCKKINAITSKSLAGSGCQTLIEKDGDDCIESWLSWLCSNSCHECNTEFKICRTVLKKLKNNCPKAKNNGCFSVSSSFDNVSDGDNCRNIEADIDNYDTSFIDNKNPPAPESSDSSDNNNNNSGSVDNDNGSAQKMEITAAATAAAVVLLMLLLIL